MACRTYIRTGSYTETSSLTTSSSAEIAACCSTSGRYVRAVADGARKVPTNRPSSIVDWVSDGHPAASVMDDAVPSGSADLESSWPMPTASEADGSDEFVSEPVTDDDDSSDAWDLQMPAELRDQVVAEFRLPRVARPGCPPWTGTILLSDGTAPPQTLAAPSPPSQTPKRTPRTKRSFAAAPFEMPNG